MFGREGGDNTVFNDHGYGDGEREEGEEVEEHFGSGVVWTELPGGFWGEIKGRGCAFFGCCLWVREIQHIPWVNRIFNEDTHPPSIKDA